MYKKIIKIALVFILIFSIPNDCIAMEDNSLLSTLIRYSYPEVKVLDKKDNIENNKKDKSKEENQFVNVYVGKENVPKPKKIASNSDKTKEVSKNKSGVDLDSSVYSSNLRVTSNDPKIFIYHTHSCETYWDSPEGNYHSKDKDNSVMSVGCLVTNELSDLGWGVIHSTKYNDIPYDSSYYNSGDLIKSVTSKYDDIKVSIDIHRNGLTVASQSDKERIEKETTTTINGEKVAKFFFVVGARNKNVSQVKALADGLTAYAKQKYPDLIMPVVVKPYGRFNQSLCENGIVVEVGSNATTTKEAQNSAKYLAKVLDGYFKEKNI